MSIFSSPATSSWPTTKADPRGLLLSDFEAGNDMDHNDEQLLTSPARVSILSMIALCCSAGGLQFFWSTVMANLAPFLHGLGLSKTMVAITLVSQPLAGAFVGPYVGLISDEMSTRWGRRRPVMVLGTVATGFSLACLAWTDELVRQLTCERGTCKSYEHAVQSLVQTVAVIATVAMSVAVQPLQSGIRSLIVDQTPLQQQTLMSSSASFLVAVGGVVGFLAGSIPLTTAPRSSWWMTQFQALTLLTIAVVALTVTVTCFFGKEATGDVVVRSEKLRRRHTLLEILRSMRKIPTKILRICKVQCSAWIAWFCVLYYTTTYITELSEGDLHENDTVDGHSVQIGTSASLCLALAALAVTTTILLILLFRERSLYKVATIHTHTMPSDLLAKLWAMSQALCGVLLLATLLPSSGVQGTVLVAFLGIPWAITQWIPFALLGNEIASLQLQAIEQGRDELQSGILLGVHNMAISFPQVFAGVMSSIVYIIAESAGSQVPTAWILSAASVAAFGAARSAYSLV